MTLPPEFQSDFDAMPVALQHLLLAELAAGNRILELGHSFPAPPAGAYFLLANPVSTRPRSSGDGLVFYARNSSHYSGEFTDERRFYFVLEAPLPPPPEPDMDAIRAALLGSPIPATPSIASRATARATPPSKPSPLERFRKSMIIDYEKWHDGIGYDLDAIAAASPAERQAIEAALLSRGAKDWRDVEALAALATPAALEVLRGALHHPDPEIRAAVLRYAPGLASDALRTQILIQGIREARFGSGMSSTLSQVAEFHPPSIRKAVLDGALLREGEVAVHLAAMAAFLYGKAQSPFDWEHRPLFLRFREEDPIFRRAAFVELCAWLGADPDSVE
jgi:hypothetical protein